MTDHEHRPVWERAAAEMGIEPDENGVLDLSNADLTNMPASEAVFVEQPSAQDQLRALDASIKTSEYEGAQVDEDELLEVVGLTIRGMTAHTAGAYPEILKAQLDQSVAALLARVEEAGLEPVGDVYVRIDVETMARRP
jgi:hypothetical protein